MSSRLRKALCTPSAFRQGGRRHRLFRRCVLAGVGGLSPPGTTEPPQLLALGKKETERDGGEREGEGERDFLQEAFGSHPAKAKKSHLCPLVCAEATSPGRRSLHPGPSRCRRGRQSRPQTALERETQQEAESFFFFVPGFGPAQLQCQEALRRQPQSPHQAPGREPERREPSFLGSRASLPGLL